MLPMTHTHPLALSLSLENPLHNSSFLSLILTNLAILSLVLPRHYKWFSRD